ncbi:AsmA family protein [Marinobacter panjinensis]|uniref:AsmA family protein n=1 Tax=Marinobacter panjinensis TaxID=2576384 RepID=A0A4U6R453_9GAMM|nr:AsmA family protein [Marinobacter panjinensis]MCR8916273.1 AsmA family protein [Marinobacter panjinensis]TKV68263.1 AsmA family protein [Marinobacter panjinensis]
MKAVRYVALAIVGLIILAIAAVAVAVAVIDPNTYKPQIEKAVEDSTNLDLILAGDIGWSFIPLGLELNDVEATLEDERLVRLDQLVAKLSFWSLVTMSPRVDTFLLNGLDANLSVDENGNGNWTRIMPEGEAKPEQEKPAAEETADEPAGDREPLNFNVESVEISNARVHYEDKGTGQAFTLEDFTLNASEITLGSSFPLNVAFRFATNQPQFAVKGDINARLAANEALNEFGVSGLKAIFDMSGEPFGGETVRAELAGSLEANLENETATLSGFTASLADLKLNTDLSVNGFGDKPKLEGSLSIDEFSLKALLAAMGQPAIETEDPEVMKALAFSTNIGGPAGTVELSDLTISLDDTTFRGDASYTLANSAVGLNLQGDAINADRYLPPASDEEAATEETPQGGGGGSAEEGDLLPLETLRSLVLDINLGLGELIVSNLTINEIKSVISARNGVLKVEDFSGQLYYGSFDSNVTLDARTDNPQWTINKDIKGVQTLPLLADLADMDMLSGGANMSVNVKTSGNRISDLRSNAKGEINFNLAEGEFTRMNLTRMACQGIALVNQEQLGSSGWGTSTPFNDMKGTLRIDGNTLTNTDLVAALAGMRLEGDGTVDLAASNLDYEIGLRIVGEIHRDEACRVTEYVENVVIPVECRGDYTEDPAGLCSFDGSRFRDTIKTIAANAAKAKADEKVDEAKSKAEEKVSEKLKEKLGEQGGEQVKDALKGLFGQ